MARRAGPSVRSRRLSSTLRKLRDKTGLSAVEVAEQLGMSSSKISRIETVDTGFYIDDLERLLDFYRVSNSYRVELLDLARHAEQRGLLKVHGTKLPEDWQTWVDFEAEASELFNYEPLMIPGLLQTAEYATAIIRATGPQLSEAEAEALVGTRMARQGLLSKTTPVHLHALIEESVLTRPIGDDGALVRQLRHLADMTSKPNVTVQVLPSDAGLHPGLNGPFVILGYDEEPSLVLLEHKMVNMFLDEAEQIDGYSHVWSSLRKLALDIDASAEFVTATAARIGSAA